ncbi:2-dehydro-3-deoxygalactonokinase [Anaeroselena agilis]|uniref:2-dehydro-3-deoxygalactonokinase n=1 Tax=Anaeroselena agilis TaxID=3063788 RepID=A0ABU3NSU9_9FIRM|nr:2-dehydro-3-deoxygalactonokinase [Selenomonadales bacterium 4137-cl]
MFYLTVDTGTTNTRVRVWRGDRVVAGAFAAVGVRDTAVTGSRARLQQGVREALSAACAEAGITVDDAGAIVASGMITSNVGLHEVPHLAAPAGLEDLAAGMVAAVVPEVADKPIWFIPGVKNSIGTVDLDNCERMDIMRGEEVEAFGLVRRLGLRDASIVVLPGSHTKFILMNDRQRIAGCLTTLAGELLSVITNNTILASALNSSFVNSINEQMVLRGAECARQVGLSRACFTVRILDQFTGCDVAEKANFLLGAVVQTDLTALRFSWTFAIRPEMPVYIAGKRELRAAFHAVLQQDGFFRGTLQAIDDEVLQDIAGFGAMTVARERGLVR